MTEQKRSWKCTKCNKDLVVQKTVFSYMGLSFSHDMEVCPVCGKIFVSREMAEGKMAEAEQQLEDK